MDSYLNEPYVRRRRGIGRWTMYGGIALSIGAVVLIFQNESAFLLSLTGVLVGTLLSQVGMVIYGRFGREPRMDEVLDGVMKGLDDEYALFHYYLGTDHALFTPAGPYAILPKLEEGEIIFEDGSWFQITEKKFPIRRTAKKSLAKIDKEALGAASSFQKKLERILPEHDLEVKPIIVFLNPQANLGSHETDILVVHGKKLKQALRRLPRGKTLSQEELEQLAGEIIS